MKELSLHILDIFYNSLAAGADLIRVKLTEDTAKRLMNLRMVDNGKGMEKDFASNVTNPFSTTRTTRRVGMGLALLEQLAITCSGRLKVRSRLGIGTVIDATFDRDSIDLLPLGDMVGTVIAMVLSLGEDGNLVYIHRLDEDEVELDTREIRKILGEDVPIESPEVLHFIEDYLNEAYEFVRT
jgi:hypothetical protein